MKARIRIDITHTVRDEQVPEKEFVRGSALSLDLPLDKDEFLQALETLTTGNMTQVITRLCDQVLSDASKYFVAMKKAGIRQLELPLAEGVPPDAGPVS